MTTSKATSKSPTKAENIEGAYGIIDLQGRPFEIPVKGSMGLLALGYHGLMAWRAKRIETEKMKDPNENIPDGSGT